MSKSSKAKQLNSDSLTEDMLLIKQVKLGHSNLIETQTEVSGRAAQEVPHGRLWLWSMSVEYMPCYNVTFILHLARHHQLFTLPE